MLWTAALLSALVHLGLVLVMLPAVLEPVERDPRKARLEHEAPRPQELVVRTVVEAVEPKPPPLEEEPEEVPEARTEPEEPKPEEEEEEPLEEMIPIDRKIVVQQTNQEEPVEANYLSDQTNRTEEETRAEKTTMAQALPGEEVPEEPEDASTPNPSPETVEVEEGEQGPDEVQQELARATPGGASAPPASAGAGASGGAARGGACRGRGADAAGGRGTARGS